MHGLKHFLKPSFTQNRIYCDIYHLAGISNVDLLVTPIYSMYLVFPIQPIGHILYADTHPRNNMAQRCITSLTGSSATTKCTEHAMTSARMMGRNKY